MIHLMTHCSDILARARERKLFLFLDYDGTIAPIAKNPRAAVLPRRMKTILQELSRAHGVKVAVISGRSLRDIKRMVGLRRVIYAGNHGLEIEDGCHRHEVFVPQYVKLHLAGVSSLLRDDLRHIKGILFEDKGLAIAIHYRNIDGKLVRFVEDAVALRTGRPGLRDILRVDTGKKVLELRPRVSWTKGNAVTWLLARYAHMPFENTVEKPRILHRIFPPKNKTHRPLGRAILPVYIGDDVTDENGFAAVARGGVPVFVGTPRPSRAAYWLRDTTEVYQFLKKIAQEVLHA